MTLPKRKPRARKQEKRVRIWVTLPVSGSSPGYHDSRADAEEDRGQLIALGEEADIVRGVVSYVIPGKVR